MVRGVSNEILYVNEVITLLMALGNGKGYQHLVDKLEKKYPGSLSKKQEEVAFLLDVEEAAKQHFQEEREKIAYYFGNNDEKEGLAQLLLLWDSFSDIQASSVDAFFECIDNYSEEEYCKLFALGVRNYLNNIRESRLTEDVRSEVEVIREIMELPSSYEEKYRVQEAFLNRQRCFEELKPLLKKMETFLKTYEKRMLAILQKNKEYWEELLNGRTYSEYIFEEYSNTTIPPNELGCKLHICFFAPSQMGVHAEVDDDGKYEKVDFGTVGIFFGEDFTIKRAMNEEGEGYREHAMTAIKHFSDKTKLEILSYIRDKSAYGTELAKATGVTNATVSHHMSALLEAGLVRIDKVDNRVYYTSDKANIEKVLVYFAKLLLDKEV